MLWGVFCPSRPPSDSRLNIQLTATEKEAAGDQRQTRLIPAADQTQFNQSDNQFDSAANHWTHEASYG